jgi:hypothetical protein
VRSLFAKQKRLAGNIGSTRRRSGRLLVEGTDEFGSNRIVAIDVGPYRLTAAQRVMGPVREAICL